MKFYTLQLYRFIAAILVMFHHLDITRSGNNGVYIFFVISGFVIYLKLFSPERPPPFPFFTNRLTKIFFLYWLALIFMYMVKPFPINRSIVNTILLVPDHISWLRVSWSLSYELYFYFLTGLVAYLLPDKYAKAFLLRLLSISTIITFLYAGGYIQIKGSSLNFLLGKNTWSFFLGLLSGYLSNTRYKSVKIHIAIPVLILAYILYSAAFTYPSDSLVSVLITGIVSLLLVSFSAAYEKRNPLPTSAARVFGLLGDASYAIYLFAPIIGTIIPGRTLQEKITIVLLTIFISILTNQFLERWWLASGRRMILRLQPSVV